MTLENVQAGFDKYNALQGASEVATQDLVDSINGVTSSYTLYRKLVFVAQPIWESGGYRYNEEYAATIGCCTQLDYQQCSDGTYASSDLMYYNRGFIQLSWCYNYGAYGAARMINGDADYFNNNPALVAELPYAVDSVG